MSLRRSHCTQLRTSEVRGWSCSRGRPGGASQQYGTCCRLTRDYTPQFFYSPPYFDRYERNFGTWCASTSQRHIRIVRHYGDSNFRGWRARAVIGARKRLLIGSMQRLMGVKKISNGLTTAFFTRDKYLTTREACYIGQFASDDGLNRSFNCKRSYTWGHLQAGNAKW